MTTALAQHRLEKRSLSPYSFHGNPSHTMTTRRLHSQHFIDNHVDERFLGHGNVPQQTQQGGSLIQKLSVHQSYALSQQLQQGFPSPPHASNETPQRRRLLHRYLSLTLGDIARVEGSLLRNLQGFRSLRLCLLFVVLSRRRFGETFLLHLVDVRLFPLRKVGQRLEDGIRFGRFCRGGEYCSSRHVASECHSLRRPSYFYLRNLRLACHIIADSGMAFTGGLFFFPSKAFLIPYPAAPLTAPKAAAFPAAMAAGMSAKRGKNPPR